MTERIHRNKQNSPKEERTSDGAPSSTEQGDKLKAELDDLLDEIDEVLEANAEDFVKSYIQKGGE